MSINHNSPETRPWWLDNNSPSRGRFNLNDTKDEVDNNNNNPPEEEQEEKEAMFEKPLTPSDVGKLNRLVIPKQHAEKHFPLDATAKGLLLSFEDESGKCWRFRYSYWNSSQSYVLTKGWSRYVKDKRLHAGDVVFFHRHRLHPQRFFITCTRRQPNPPAHVSTTSRSPFYAAHPYPAHHHHHLPFPYQPHSLHAGGGSQEGQNETTPGSSGRVLRLFGVNMECQPQPDNDSEASTPECSYGVSSTHHLYHNHNHPHQTSYSSSNPHHHMDEDVNQKRNHQEQR